MKILYFLNLRIKKIIYFLIVKYIFLFYFLEEKTILKNSGQTCCKSFSPGQGINGNTVNKSVKCEIALIKIRLSKM